jgi:F-type H+-transporting ATPase subunit b
MSEVVAPLENTIHVEAVATHTETHTEEHPNEALLAQPTTWVAVSFVLFTLLILKFGLPKIKSGLDARSGDIASKINDAAKIKAEAEAILLQAKAKLANVESETEKLLNDAKSQADAYLAKAKAETDSVINARKNQALTRISQLENEAKKEITNRITSESVELAAKTITEKLTADKAASLIDEAISSLK